MPLAIKYQMLPYYNDRPSGVLIDTLVIHSMYAKDYNAKFDLRHCLKVLSNCKVSAHYALDRSGKLWSMVPAEKRAWHAGVSKMPSGFPRRDNVNDFSIGIELIGSEQSGFTKRQYKKLAALTRQLMKHYPIRFIVGHEHIAAGRKHDPGPNFHWKLYKQLLGEEARGLKLCRY